MTAIKHHRIFIVITCACILFFGNYSRISFAELGMKIVEPLEGDVFISGEEIPVAVELVDGHIDQDVVIITLYTIDTL